MDIFIDIMIAILSLYFAIVIVLLLYRTIFEPKSISGRSSGEIYSPEPKKPVMYDYDRGEGK